MLCDTAANDLSGELVNAIIEFVLGLEVANTPGQTARASAAHR